MAEVNEARSLISRLIRPRVSDCLVIWVLLGFCFTVPMIKRLSDPDIWWHLRTGRLILETGSIPSADPFSYTVHGSPWVAHEWLSEVVFWLTYSGFGFAGLQLLKSMLILAVFTVVFVTARARAGDLRSAAAATALSAWTSIAFWSERPQLFGYLLIATLVWLVHRFRRRGSLWPAVPLFALWINLHGSWLVGLALLSAGGAEAVLEGEARYRRARVASFALVLAAVVVALFANPRPLSYVAYPFQYLGSTHHTRYITEWQSPDFHELLLWGGLILFVVGLPVLLRYSRARIRPVELVVVLGLLATSLYSMRHLPVFAIVSTPLLAEHLASIWRERYRSAVRTRDVGESVILNWLIIAALPFLFFSLVPSRGPTPYLGLKNHFPVKAFNYLARESGGGKLLTSYDWGGYAIFRLWPRYRVYIDGRADVYGPAMISRVSKLDSLKPGWRKELDRAAPDVIVWPADEALSQALELIPDWRRADRGGFTAAVFLPAESAPQGGLEGHTQSAPPAGHR